MANTALNVSVGKPKVGGAIYCAPLGTTLPTDATTALNAAFKCLGYVSDDGLTNGRETETGNINAWGGDRVLDYGAVSGDTFKFKLLESLNADVLKVIYGDDNVTVGEDGAIKISVGSQLPSAYAWVVETVLTGDKVKRIVVPQAAVTEVADIVYKDDEAIGYDTTISALPDTAGKYHYEYIA